MDIMFIQLASYETFVNNDILNEKKEERNVKKKDINNTRGFCFFQYRMSINMLETA